MIRLAASRAWESVIIAAFILAYLLVELSDWVFNRGSDEE